MYYISVPGAIAACVALTWDNFTGMGLVPRLIAMLVLAIVLQELLARYLAPEDLGQDVGFRPHEPRPKDRKRTGKLIAIIVLAAASVVISFLAWLQTERFVVSAERSEQNGVQTLTISAAWIEATRVDIRLPPPPVQCDIEEKGASFTEVDWDQPDRTLQINVFVSPQVVTIKCKNAAQLGQRGFIVAGPADGPYFSSDLKWFSIIIFVMGVVTWGYGVIRLRQQ